MFEVLFLWLHGAEAELKVLIITELRRAPKGLPLLWYGARHHGLRSALQSLDIPENQAKEGLASEGRPPLHCSLDRGKGMLTEDNSPNRVHTVQWVLGPC